MPASRHKRTPEWLIFAVATAATLLHALDDAFVHRGAGLGLGQHTLAGAGAVVAAVAGVSVFAALRPGLRSAVAFGFGSLALVNGMLHVTHVRAYGVADSDVTGLLATAAGLVLVGLAVAIPWRHRGEGAVRAWQRHTIRALVVPAGLLAVLVTILPVGMSIVDAHKSRAPVGAPPGADYREVAFRASDGLRIAGWYRPSRNGAAMLVVHGGGSDRRGAIGHAKMLARHGYGVLLYDSRGRGESQGSPNGYGWGWTKDVAGALGFLEHRPDVQPDRIGALGLSTGADVILEAAAGRADLHAVVTDGAAAGSFADWQRLRGTTAMTPLFWSQFAALKVLTGDTAGPPLADLVPRIKAPLMLISADHHEERDFNVKYARLARGPVTHWNLPETGHTHGLRDHPREYERRVARFLDDALR